MMLKSQEPQTSIEVGMEGASEPWQEGSERSVEVWRLVTVHTRRKSPPPPKNVKVTNRTGIFYKR